MKGGKVNAWKRNKSLLVKKWRKQGTSTNKLESSLETYSFKELSNGAKGLGGVSGMGMRKEYIGGRNYTEYGNVSIF